MTRTRGAARLVVSFWLAATVAAALVVTPRGHVAPRSRLRAAVAEYEVAGAAPEYESPTLERRK